MMYVADFTQEERDLLIGLLDIERGELPSEIRHCRVPKLHDQLQGRLRLVEQLLKKLG